MPDHFIVQSYKDLNSVGARLPLFRRRFPFGKAVATYFAIPGNGLIMDEIAIPEPKGRPLCTGCHLVIAEDGAHIVDGILEDSGSLKIGQVRTVPCELERAENCIRIRCYNAFK